jgi:hypothetical protein
VFGLNPEYWDHYFYGHDWKKVIGGFGVTG